ncbi:hypothetical protein GOODEAATRI_014107 [Goodea atripinnis]|uniref:SURP motif domain-containing protein n=1 Tax=Goodea atripinnis TaxID=208336 RepID=A0ABV0MRY4_9TELE
MPPGPVQIVQPESNNKLFYKPIVGIIYPPPEVRNIVDKTASFVARNGPEFEARIRQNEINNPKFNFLNPNDPYHAYYRHKVNEFKEGKAQEPSAAVPKVQSQVIQETVIPKEPPPEFEFIADPPSISAFDLDVVKLTAQFVARNGRQFLTQLMQKEQRNYQFDFLRPQHSLFNYFTKLVEQYTKILIPPKGLLIKLKKEAVNPKEVMDQGSDDEEEGMKVPLPPDNPMPPPLPPAPTQVIIRKDYDPKASKMQEHMRIGLLDPRWLEQRDRSIRDRQTEDEVYAPGLDIESSLKQLAERRTDIFGVEETAIGKKIGEEEIQKPEEKVTWDGHSGSMARTQQAAQANITLQEQIEAIHKAKGLVGEDETKEKIGPSKPSDIHQPPPIPSSAPSLHKPSPPVTAVPRPPLSMPPMIPAPRVNVVPMPPAPHLMAPRPPPMVVPTAFVPAPPIPQPPSAAPAPPIHPPPPHEEEPVSKKMKTEDNLIPEEEFLRRNKVC